MLTLKRVIDTKILLFLVKLNKINFIIEYINCPTCLIIRFKELALFSLKIVLLTYYNLFKLYLFLKNIVFYIFGVSYNFVFTNFSFSVTSSLFWISKIQSRKVNINNAEFKSIDSPDIDIISIIFGSLLGKSEAEKREKGICINFFYKAIHLDYSHNLFNYLCTLGYCKPEFSIIKKSLGKKGKLYKSMRFWTCTLVNFDWIYDMWYINNIKTIPNCIGKYLTPLALATFIMDSGVKTQEGLSFNKSFTYSECELLVKVLDSNFKLKANIKSTGTYNQHKFCILKESIPSLRNQVDCYFIPSLKYKLIFN